MYTLAKHPTTQNLTSNSPFWFIWSIATSVINANLHQNDLKNACFLFFCFFLFSLFFRNAVFFNYFAPINMINAISLSVHSRCN